MSNNQEAPRGFNSIQSRGVKEETSIMFERTIYIMILYIYIIHCRSFLQVFLAVPINLLEDKFKEYALCPACL